jgi:hypothetical protein
MIGDTVHIKTYSYIFGLGNLFIAGDFTLLPRKLSFTFFYVYKTYLFCKF